MSTTDAAMLVFAFVDTEGEMRLRVIWQGQCLECVLSPHEIAALDRAVVTWRACHQPQEDTPHGPRP